MSRQDIARAMNEAVAASEGSASGHGPRLAQQLLPPVQVHVIECAAVSAQLLATSLLCRGKEIRGIVAVNRRISRSHSLKSQQYQKCCNMPEGTHQFKNRLSEGYIDDPLQTRLDDRIERHVHQLMLSHD